MSDTYPSEKQIFKNSYEQKEKRLRTTPGGEELKQANWASEAILKDILEQLKIINLHLSEVTNQEIKEG